MSENPRNENELETPLDLDGDRDSTTGGQAPPGESGTVRSADVSDGLGDDGLPTPLLPDDDRDATTTGQQPPPGGGGVRQDNM